ncbi:hypothetical protein [Robertmurraya massiliosenegalensis]|uniref:hypothetical protein n=1 Tax=Robertmurraya massiliosenegalensis TaxID=1287657 RepID=UPI0002ED97D5|nr:hypothetical protein [Robertmurraya massiliosenegalensis]
MYEYNPEVTYLLINHSEEKVEVFYQNQSFQLPLIGKRPPYYAYPKYEQSYPII